LKELLTNALNLKVVDPNEDFVVCIDACKEGLGGVFTQNGHAIYYESRKLTKHEINYATHDLELAAIFHALKMLRNYLTGRKCKLKIDHGSLKHLFEQLMLNARHTRWLEFLIQYEFNIKHIKGKKNRVVDALSRRVHEMNVASISMYCSYLKSRNLEVVALDQRYTQVTKGLQHENILLTFKN
jgi:hypothetical protein